MEKLHNTSIIEHYNSISEQERLSTGLGHIECIRTKEIIEQYMPGSPAIVLDIGGATGTYSCWLAKKGYEVHLIDPVSKHIELAKQASDNQPDAPIVSFTVGDARAIEYGSSFADVVLLMGPLYHLQEYEDRMRALKESHRVLKKGGILFVAAISRFASCIDGLMSGYGADPEFQKIMIRDLQDGKHHNHTDNVLYFTDAYFHRPEELRSELEEAGFHPRATHAIESLGYLLKDGDETWNNADYIEFVLNTIRKIDTEPSLMGASPHFMCIATKTEKQTACPLS